MADISQITLPSGTTYNLKDAWARQQIQAITGGDAIVFKGVSSTALTDGGNENPTVDGSAVTIKNIGDLYFYNKEEFIYGDDSKWHSLGPQLQTLGDLAYKNSVTVKYDKTTSVTSSFSGAASTYSGSYTPGGTVSAPTISVQTAGSTATIKNPTKVTVAKTVAAAVPSGTVSNEVTYYNVANQNLTLYKIGYTTGDSITTSDVTVKTGDAAYSSSQPTFSGTAATVNISGTPSGTVTSTPNNTNTNATVSYS